MKRILGAAAVVLCATTVAAQTYHSGAGWEAFSPVKYEGGDAAQPVLGVLVLSDTTVGLYACARKNCAEVTPQQQPFQGAALLEIPITAITGIRTTNRMAMPAYDDVVITYDRGTTVEAPLFRVSHLQAAAVDAKIRSRLSKLGGPDPR